METLQWILSTGTNILEATQLNGELSRLRGTLPMAQFLINRGEWARFKDPQLAKLLSQLRDATYDAEDILREFEDQVLRQKIGDAGRSWAGQLLSSSLCLAKSLICRSKTRVKETQDRLNGTVAQVEAVLNHMGIPVEPLQQLMPETSSVISIPQVFGRDTERDELMEMLGVTIERADEIDRVIGQMGVPLTRGTCATSSRSAGPKAKGTSAAIPRAKRLKGSSSRNNHTDENKLITSDVSVLPIYGIGGMGKTTLAQFIYNDPRVQAHFGVTIWVCVSDLFDRTRITKEIIESIPAPGKFNTSCSLDALQAELMKRLKGQKFLLVLDDIWPKATAEWEVFYGPLKHGPEGSMILVTTRCPGVAKCVATSNCEPVELKGLPADIFWEFFKKCAFGTKLLENYPPELQDIGRSISNRLCGSPLAAKTLGRLLNMDLTEQHWRTVQESELWQLPHEDNEILPALRLSYLYLPQELKRCFAFCSMFPKDHSFERHEIIDMWVAQGFIETRWNMRPEDKGAGYLDDLRRRFLFQHDPKFPTQARYVMHDLIHDMAQSVSVDECFLMQDLSYQNHCRIPKHVRHMSVELDGEPLSRVRDTLDLNKLRSLRFGKRFGTESTWFNQLSNILYLSLKGCKLEKLPESICELTSLRYLDISHSRVEELPVKFFSLYSLQVLDASRSSLKTIGQDVTKLINLRYAALPAKASLALSRVSGLGNMPCLRNLSDFTVGRQDGRGIGELRLKNLLSGKLCIRSLCYVECKEAAAEARLGDKQYLKELVLEWREHSTASLKLSENGVFESLRPHSRIEHLKVQGFQGDRLPSWFIPEGLSSLTSLELSRCSFLKSLSVLDFPDETQAGLLTGDDGTQMHESSSITSCSNGIGSSAFRRLTELRLFCCGALTNLDQFLSPENLPSIKSISIERCFKVVSIPVHSFVEFTCLQDLKLCYCAKLVCPREMVLPPSIRRLCIIDCNELDRSFPACLGNLTSLSLLKLISCHNVKSLSLLNLIGTNKLKCLILCLCHELSSIEGSHALSSIQHVQLSSCPKLKGVQQPFVKKELRSREDRELLKFLTSSSIYFILK